MTSSKPNYFLKTSSLDTWGGGVGSTSTYPLEVEVGHKHSVFTSHLKETLSSIMCKLSLTFFFYRKPLFMSKTLRSHFAISFQKTPPRKFLHGTSLSTLFLVALYGRSTFCTLVSPEIEQLIGMPRIPLAWLASIHDLLRKNALDAFKKNALPCSCILKYLKISV